MLTKFKFFLISLFCFLFLFQFKPSAFEDEFQKFLNEGSSDTDSDSEEFDSTMSAIPGNDINFNGLDDSFEIDLGTRFMPNIWGDPGEDCGPYQDSDFWCNNGVHPARHSKGFIAYQVKNLGFSDLWAIEYTVFLDSDCGILGGFGSHLFDNEGFTVLIRKVNGTYQLESLQSFTHHNTGWEIVDRYFPHELYRYDPEGLLMAKNKHGMYVHHRICDGALDTTEACGRYPKGVDLFNDGTRMLQGLYNVGRCPCCDEANNQSCLQCWEQNITHSDCFGQNLKRYGGLAPYNGDLGDYRCFSYSGWSANLTGKRKQLPPFIPMSIPIPQNFAYVELFENQNYTYNPARDKRTMQINFGNDLVAAGMPMRLFRFTDYAWWREYYDPDYNLKHKNSNSIGISSSAHRYKYWTSDDQISYVSKSLRSLRMNGLPGTILSLYEYSDGALNWDRTFFIGNNKRSFALPTLGTPFDSIKLISWGLGPAADAGVDRILQPDSDGMVILDGSNSYQYAIDKFTIMTDFNIRNFDYTKDYNYGWYIRNGETLTHIGDGAILKTDKIPPGTHTIRLQVSGWRYIQPRNPSLRTWGTVWDEAQITVDQYTDVEDEIAGALPTTFSLKQNYPNPFNPSTTIEFTVAEPVLVKIEIFNSLGQHIKTLIDDEKSKGTHTIEWDGTDEHENPVATGVYFYRLIAGDNTETKKMILVK